MEGYGVMGFAPSGCDPCGRMICTAEEYPKVLFANEQMFHLLDMVAECENWRAFISQNVFFMIPFEDHLLFREHLRRAKEQGEPVAVEHSIRTESGVNIPVIGWIHCVKQADGSEELHLIYMRAPEERQAARRMREQAYLNMLKGTYDYIFEIDHKENTLECVYRKDGKGVRCVPGVRVVMNGSMKDTFLEDIYEEDRASLENFYRSVMDRRCLFEDGRLEYRFSAMNDGVLQEYYAVASRLDDKVTILCARDVTETRYAALLEEEVDRLRIMQMSIASMEQERPTKTLSFRMVEGRVFPTSGRNAVCEYCRFSEDEYLYMKDAGLQLEEFLEKCHIVYGKYITALQEGEVDFEEVGDGLIKMYISKHIVLSAQREEYTMMLLYPVRDTVASRGARQRVSIRTFGHFDVFVDGEPVVFHYEKSKEMLAVLVDRNGGYVSNPYFISCLWESEPYSEKIQGRCRQAAHRLMETLKQYGIEHIVEKSEGKRRLVPELVDCDYYNYVKGLRIPGQQFSGSYMSDYSWGEETLSGLLKISQ